MSSNGVVFVTGGNRGIGLAIAQRFAQDGFKVAISYREQKPAEDFYMVKADVTDSKSIDAAIDEIEKNLGPLEVVVINAGTNTWDRHSTIRDGVNVKFKVGNCLSMIS